MDKVKTLQHPFVEGANTDSLSEVGEATPSLRPFPGAVGLRPSGAFEDLEYYRLEYPFVPMLPLPTFVLTKVLSANVASNIDIPSGMALGMMKGNGNFWASWLDTARIPVAPSTTYENSISQSVYMPVDTLFYVKNISQLSFISDNPVTVTVMGWPVITSGVPGINNKGY